MKRHYSTIGIGDVFLQPPPADSLPSNYFLANLTRSNSNLQQQQQQQQAQFLSWEIVGTIKMSPQDFVVREIADPKRIIPGLSAAEMKALQVADLSDDVDNNTNNDDDNIVDGSSFNPSVERGEDTEESTLAGSQQQATTEKDDRTIGQKDNNHDEVNASNVKVIEHVAIEVQPTITELSPHDALLNVLNHVYPGTDGSLTINPTSTMSSLEQLQQQALRHMQRLSQGRENRIAITAETEKSNNKTETEANLAAKSLDLPMIQSTSSFVMIPTTASSSTSNHQRETKGGDRGEFHRALRAAFPLLKSQVLPRALGADENDNQESFIRVSVEDALDDILPYLYQPEVDVVRLLQLRHRGFQTEDRPGQSGGVSGGGGQVALRLLPTLPRERRREVHAVLERACPEFVRTTDPNFPLLEEEEEVTTKIMPDGDISSDPPAPPQQTAAILLWWSKRSQLQATRKRKRQTESNNTKNTNTSSNAKPNVDITSKTTSTLPHTLCVMKKVQTEHLTAINHLKTAVRCTPSDIGLAGIKDMQAVTYQFCTFRHVAPHRLVRANQRLLQHGMQLGKIHSVDWQLNQGDLYGNRFDITVRGLKRVQVSVDCDGRAKEELIPCDRQHVISMVHRIQTQGFINFYGDQRVGLPGSSEDVGVRSFDIGRAMLQRDFTKVIDLLMTGRVTSNESPAARQARDIWRQSGGDVVSTLKAMPHGFARERVVLQGLKRYGKDNPLAAIKCLHFGVRAFWVNAFQSYVWNKMATRRIELFGTAVVPGDLYFVGEENTGEVEVVKKIMEDVVHLSQVVLPLPGYKIQYPENQIGEGYRELLKSEGVEFDQDAPSEATAKGGYRRLIVAVEQMNVSFEEDDDNSEHVKSMTLTFDLTRGSYATSVLRELMVTTIGRDESKPRSVLLG